MSPVGKTGNRAGTAKNLLKPSRTGQPLSIFMSNIIRMSSEGEWKSCAAFSNCSNKA